ncbi:MAG TPA: tRNA (N6-threonylcarbamoyladenosine(37)-N6)-methyltransferase TrmO [Gemmatimonadales bacterium]|jgi:tRNA-Thr(GGU) m(6)t(6)A37 methyltransferase TsaA|nr:tRNA (N6-threonylcarbamoyladenosine(37)-N6)-methyltransferase TrmO [Gemmatimonadales bacterium]
MDRFELRPIGRVHSPLTRRKDAPRQPWEGAPEAWIEIDPAYLPALHLLAEGDEIWVLTWLHASRRDTVQVHPGRDPDAPLTGVFATRSPDRPNPIGLHRTRVLHIEDGTRLHVEALEAIDGTPVVDIKCVLRHEG